MEITKRTNEEWLKIYRQQRESGKTMRAWCTEKNINANTLSDRVSRLRKAGLIEGKKPPGGKYPQKNVKIGITETVSNEKTPWIEVLPTKNKVSPVKEICIEIGKFKIKLKSDFCEKTFLRTCELLVSLC